GPILDDLRRPGRFGLQAESETERPEQPVELRALLGVAGGDPQFASPQDLHRPSAARWSVSISAQARRPTPSISCSCSGETGRPCASAKSPAEVRTRWRSPWAVESSW